MHCSTTDISKLIDKDIMSITVGDLKKALLELDDDYMLAFKTADCLLTGLIRRYKRT